MSSQDVNTPYITVVFIFASYIRSVALRISWICSVNIFKALLLQLLINAARRWPTTKNSNGQRRGGAAIKKQINWGAWVAPPTNK